MRARLLIGGVLLSLVGACGGATGSVGPTLPPPASPEAGASAPIASPGATATAQPIASRAAACVAPPRGLVAWWRAQNDAKDVLGAPHRTLPGGPPLSHG